MSNKKFRTPAATLHETDSTLDRLDRFLMKVLGKVENALDAEFSPGTARIGISVVRVLIQSLRLRGVDTSAAEAKLRQTVEKLRERIGPDGNAIAGPA
ncbi:MAG: hypothetical protein KDB90_00550 [Planctomycetes bacterium]|nr:hypothetical protein [Planctomycetota bacterium]